MAATQQQRRRATNGIYTPRNIFLLLLSVFVSQMIRQNPMLLGLSVGPERLPSNETFPIYTSHAVLDAVLEYHGKEIGEADYTKYRNHCLRVLSFAGYYIQQYEGYRSSGAKTAIPPHIMDVMALALAYHDIGLWTAGKLNYLEPSVATLNRDFQQNLVLWPTNFTTMDLETARTIIWQHHKWTHWKPDADDWGNTVDAAAVNAVRRGDWADATVGLVKSGLPPAFLEQAYNVIPEAGFHLMLAGMGGRLSPDSLLGQLDVLHILRW